ncbi:hypothetical protein AVEN_28751-1 [Araneus ventricosus]|uniref:Uncharacterized protein n=1 Tax=Araneus ventricosus TaxID=182803 RepID=A0A4Y2SGY7_ARAVE|nr:hypothetical protein AVEN_28751-1 [Araneus ventricosus]
MLDAMGNGKTTNGDQNSHKLFGDVPATADCINLKIFQNSQLPPLEVNVPSSQVNVPKSRYVPPIFLDIPKNVPQLLAVLSDLTKERITGSMVANNKVKIFPQLVILTDRAIQTEITSDGLKSHTYEFNNENQIEIVIRRNSFNSPSFSRMKSWHNSSMMVFRLPAIL